MAALGLVAVAAVAGAQGGNLLQSGQGNVSIDLPDGENLGGAAGGALPACSNTQDDDGDGITDVEDPGCQGPLDTDEYNAPEKRRRRTSTTTPGGTTTTPDTDPQPKPERPDLDRPDIGGNGGGGKGDGGNGTGGVKPDKGKGTTTPPSRAAATSSRSRRCEIPTAAPAARTRRSRSPTSPPRRSGSPTRSSTSSRSRPSCFRSTRPAGPSTGSRGRCSPRSTASRPISASSRA